MHSNQPLKVIRAQYLHIAAFGQDTEFGVAVADVVLQLESHIKARPVVS